MSTEQEIRDAINEIAETADPDKVARLEIVREYFTNPEFREQLSEYVWKLNAGRASQ